MKHFIIPLLIAALVSGCSFNYYTITDYPSTKLTSKKSNPLADQKIDSINHYLARNAPGNYVQYIRTYNGQLLGFCFYLNDSTYPAIQRLMNLPNFKMKELEDGFKVQQIATDAGSWLWNNVHRKNRANGVRVVLGTEKGHPYNTYEFGLVTVKEESRLPGFVDEKEVQEFQFVRGYRHHGYELIRDCFYCF